MDYFRNKDSNQLLPKLSSELEMTGGVKRAYDAQIGEKMWKLELIGLYSQ